jgi:glutamyl-tRNA reductase
MLKHLHLINFSNLTNVEIPLSPDYFVLKTCQRTLILSYENDLQHYVTKDTDFVTDQTAYEYLLEIICGLKSKLLGENEIVNQFKSAYKDYLQNEKRNNKLIIILEKLFKDAKEIRSEYLTGIAQKTYASLTRKIIYRENNEEDVLILGSGQLAEDLINQFKKKKKIYISARNIDKVSALAKIHNLEIIPFPIKDIWANFANIVNTIGFEGELLSPDFFQKWKTINPNGVFIDLGSPSPIQTDMNLKDKVYRLNDIFSEGAVTEAYKHNQIQMAKNHLNQLAVKRNLHFQAMLTRQETYVGI